MRDGTDSTWTESRAEGSVPAEATWHEGSAAPPSSAPTHIRYRLLEELGSGGMGRVLAAMDLRLKRIVAIKEARPGTEARLAREAEILARLEHPNIVPVHDQGRLDGGRAFYAMRRVRGQTLAEALARTGSLEERLRLVRPLLAVAEAVAYAHAARVLHRDLKPSNVLLGEFGEVQLMDWGIARSLDEATASGEEAPPSASTSSLSAALTAAGGVLGTPRYMSPEQARGEALDERSDLWSLGAMLYELICGQPPYLGNATEALAAARVGRVPPLRDRCPRAPADLCAIAERALRADRQARYPSARALARDLEAWLDGRRVEAHDYSPRELLARLVRAWRGPLLVGLVGLLALLTTGTVAVGRILAERDRALSAEEQAHAALFVAEERLASSLLGLALAAQEDENPAVAELAAARALTLGEAPEARGVLAASSPRGRPRLLESFPAPTCEQASFTADPRRIFCVDTHGSGAWAVERGEYAWRDAGGYWMAAGPNAWSSAEVVEEPGGHVRDVGSGRVLPGPHPVLAGRVIGATPAGEALVSGQGPVYLLRPGQPQAHELGRCGDGARPQVARVAGAHMVVACYDGELLRWRDGAPLPPLPSPMPTPTALAITGDRLVVGNAGGRMAVLDLRSGQRLREGDAELGPVRAIEPWGDGETFVLLADRGLGWWDARTGRLRLRLPTSDARAIAVVEGSLWVLARRVERWAAPAELPARVLYADNGLAGLAFSPDGAELLTYGGGGEIKAWRVADGRRLADWRVGSQVIKAAAVLGGGRVAAISAHGHGLNLIEGSRIDTPALMREGSFKRAIFLGDDWAVLAGYGEELRVWRLGAPEPAVDLDLGAMTVDALTLPGQREGRVLDSTGRVWRVEGDPPRAEPLFQAEGTGVMAASAHRIALATSTEIQLRDAAGSLLRTLPAVGTRGLALSPDDRWLAAGMIDGRTLIWAMAEDRPRAILRGHGARVQGVAFSPDSRTLATASWDGRARLWDLSVLDEEPERLLQEREQAWGRRLEELVEGSRLAVGE